ncbi:MAG: GIY-YIG nuclease family protein [Dysgonamonadaceae bacterium]|jgi:predicted GIY-YIG superfamily endonuclease|nr:GIY-YIG nuclease family protein [Dysgonamonadaceae bacterium]
MEKQYIYIVQASLELSKCKIGKTCDLERRLTEYNSMTGKSQENVYRFLFTCEVSDMATMEKDIKEQFKADRENKSREIYFYNSVKFENYVGFIKSHKLFKEEIFIKSEDKKEVVMIVKKTTPSLEERGLTHQGVMERAKRIKYDEFYTRYEDVEKEISMYNKSIWQNKTVFCNCDDAIDEDDRKTSAFVLYFKSHFKELGLRKLICIHYAGKVDLFNQGSKAYIAYISYTTDGENIYKDYPKNYDGSFDHPVSLKILKEEADIVCTNPPFSRSIDFWKIIIECGKKFLIISNIRIAIHSAYLPYFKNNQVWAGYNRVDYFLNPKRQLTDAAGHWYTNIPIDNRPKYERLKIMPLKNIPEEYKKYDDSKTLLVDNCYIPNNIKKPFAVSARPILNGLLENGYEIFNDKEYIPRINNKTQFSRVLVQKI